ncbi:MAG: hypothetical protein ACI4TM_06775 [Candidatus Cryptobacteroides sp.]
MNKHLFLFAVVTAFLVASSPLYARNTDDRRFSDYEINFGWAGYPIVDVPSNHYLIECFKINGTLEDIYTNADSGFGKILCTGVISAEFNLTIKRWFSISVQANFAGLWSPEGYYSGGVKTDNVSGISASIVPYARFTYFSRPKVSLYSSVGLGLNAIYVSHVTAFEFLPAFQTVPFGIRTGKKAYFLFETGLGTVFCGARIGVGFKF